MLSPRSREMLLLLYMFTQASRRLRAWPQENPAIASRFACLNQPGAVTGSREHAILIRVDRDQIVQLLERHDVQVTAQRVEVAALLLDRPQHVSADQVRRRLQDNGVGVSKATVYNTLKLFCDSGLLRTVDVDPVRQYYDSRTQPHHHFFNVDTGELTDIDPEDIDLSISAALPQGTVSDGAEVLIRVRRQPAG